MTFHPREGFIGDDPHHPMRLSRRGFLAAAAATGLAGVAGCSSSPSKGAAATTTTSTSPLPLPRPDSPVTWPIYASNKAIANGLQPEKNATLKIYNWVAYVNQKDLDAFGKKYGCKVELTTFNTMTEAISKLRSGQFDFDVFVPTVDVLGPLVAGKIIQPLNHTYIPNISQAWTEFTNPFYDGNWNYTVPYTIYTTGMAWRKDHVPEDPSTLANPWAFPWQAKYKGKVAVLDDYRESMSLGLMKSGYFDLNTGDKTQLAAATNALLDLDKLVNLHIDNNDYSNVPSGQIWIHYAWSGDMAAAAGYMPKGTPVEVIGYWFPSDSKGPVGNDTMAVLSGGKNPVLAHLFLNYMLDLPNVL
ncbi:MAG TPA: spermidine/putrescine ABC transporter substrate-binding protein, partial [Acidimicrobiales bacterium]|nr:spermidine/putrescine ABC transporter substrate-binding protein [Acidimicrobiales bacterium]